MIIKLSQSEFSDNDDPVGFTKYEPEPFNFLTEESFERTVEITPNSTNLSFEFILSNKKHTLEREAYTFFALIGDLGGFNGAIIILPSFLMTLYSSRIFDAQLLEDLPVRKEKKKERSKVNNLRDKL